MNILKISIIIFFISIQNIFSQSKEIDTLIFDKIAIIENDFKPKKSKNYVNELSGIEYSGIENEYYLLPQSSRKPIYYVVKIEEKKDVLNIEFKHIIKINAKSFDGESIRKNPFTNEIYLAEENDYNSAIYKVEKDSNLLSIISLYKQPYNSGFEGMSFNNNGDLLWLSQERPENGRVTDFYCYNIYNLEKPVKYTYELDSLQFDYKQNNGISEILCLSNNDFIVVERAYIEIHKQTSVRIYQAFINNEDKTDFKLQKSKLLTDFKVINKIDNIEGVCLNSTKDELIFISDNNDSKTQKTQIISMKIIYKNKN